MDLSTLKSCISDFDSALPEPLPPGRYYVGSFGMSGSKDTFESALFEAMKAQLDINSQYDTVIDVKFSYPAKDYHMIMSNTRVSYFHQSINRDDTDDIATKVCCSPDPDTVFKLPNGSKILCIVSEPLLKHALRDYNKVVRKNTPIGNKPDTLSMKEYTDGGHFYNFKNCVAVTTQGTSEDQLRINHDSSDPEYPGHFELDDGEQCVRLYANDAFTCMGICCSCSRCNSSYDCCTCDEEECQACASETSSNGEDGCENSLDEESSIGSAATVRSCKRAKIIDLTLDD